jgi:septum formation protein
MSDGEPNNEVLASTSAIRRQVLSAAGVAFESERPGVDEDAIKGSLLAEGLGPRDIADALAEAKAVKVSLKRPGLVIGADQTLDFEGRLYDKAHSIEEARGRLIELRGKSHKLHCGMVVARAGQPIWREVVTTTLRMRPFSDAFLDAYLERTAPTSCRRSAATSWKVRGCSCSTGSTATTSPSSAWR